MPTSSPSLPGCAQYIFVWVLQTFSYSVPLMELRHLRYFVMVAEEKNFSRASARLNISQPAVSKQIRELEEELGAQLLARDGVAVRLTPAGETFFAHACDILKRATAATNEMRRFQKSADRLAVAYAAPIFARLAGALHAFETAHPKVEVNLQELSPRDQISALRAGNVDLGLIADPCDGLNAEFEINELEKTRLDAALPSSHPLAKRKQLALKELANELFVGFSEKAEPGRNATITKACQSAGFTPRFRHEAESIAGALAIIRAGKAISLLPQEARDFTHSNVTFLAIKPPTPYLVLTAISKRMNSCRAISDFVNFCREALQKTKSQSHSKPKISRKGTAM